MSEAPAAVVEHDEDLRALRMQHADATSLLLCMSFGGATIELHAPKGSGASVRGGTHYPGVLKVAGHADAIVGWVRSVPYHLKDQPLKIRTCLVEPSRWWLPARWHVEPGDQTLEVEYYPQGAEEPSATCTLRPRLAWCGGVGARVRTLERVSVAEEKEGVLLSPCSGTLVRWLDDGTASVRIDNSGGEERTLDMTPEAVSPAPPCPSSYVPGDEVLLLQDGALVDANVLGTGGAAGSHTVRLTGVGRAGSRDEAAQQIELELNPFSCCKRLPHFSSAAEYVTAADEYCALAKTEAEIVVDAVTGRRLRASDHQLLFDTAQTSGTWPGKHHRVSDVSALAKLMVRATVAATQQRSRGSCGAHPVLIRGGPGAGKTTAIRQLAAAIAAAGRAEAPELERTPLRPLPLVISAQKLARHLQSASGSAAPTDLVSFYIEAEFAERPSFRHVLRQARAITALVVLLDGLDEAVGWHAELERLVLNELVPAGGWLVAAARPEGATLLKYRDRFLVLTLQPLSDAQQGRAVSSQLGGLSFFDNLLGHSRHPQSETHLAYFRALQNSLLSEGGSKEGGMQEGEEAGSVLVADTEDEAPIPDGRPDWYYADPSAGQAGPVNGGAIVKMFAAGTLSGDTLAWNPDLSGWTPLANIPDLQPPEPKPPPPTAEEVEAEQQRQLAEVEAEQQRQLAEALAFLMEAASEPVLLSMLVLVFGDAEIQVEGGRGPLSPPLNTARPPPCLPRDRFELYEAAVCEAVSRTRAPGGESGASDTMTLLRRVAAANQMAGRSVFDGAEVARVLSPSEAKCWAALRGAPGGVPLIRVLAESCSGDPEESEYRFSHPSFQEALFAQALTTDAELRSKVAADKSQVLELLGCATHANVFRIGGRRLGMAMAPALGGDAWQLQSQLNSATVEALPSLLRGNAAITALDLSNNRLGDVSQLITAIDEMPSLTTTNFLANGLNEASAEALCALARRRRLSLCGLPAGPHEALLASQRLDAADAMLLAADVRQFASTLRTLALTGNHLGPLGVARLMEALAERSGGVVGRDNDEHGDGDGDGDGDGSSGASGNVPVVRLELTRNGVCGVGPGQQVGEWNDAGLRGIGTALSCRCLVSLGLGGNELGDAGCELLAAALYVGDGCGLVRLGLRDNNIRVAGAVAVATVLEACRVLAELDLGQNRLCGAWLDADGTRVGSYSTEGIDAIAAALQLNGAGALQLLDVRECCLEEAEREQLAAAALEASSGSLQLFGCSSLTSTLNTVKMARSWRRESGTTVDSRQSVHIY